MSIPFLLFVAPFWVQHCPYDTCYASVILLPFSRSLYYYYLPYRKKKKKREKTTKKNAKIPESRA